MVVRQRHQFMCIFKAKKLNSFHPNTNGANTAAAYNKYTAERTSSLYRIISSSKLKSTLANGGLLTVVDLSEALMGDIIDSESAVTGEDLFMRAAMPAAGLTRRRKGLKSANPDADGRVVASMATMAKVTEVKRRVIYSLLLFIR